MNTTQSWAGLPDHIKRQAAPDMLAGGGWYHHGRLIEHPGGDELRRWAGIAPQSPQAGAEVAGSIEATEAGVFGQIRAPARTAPQNTAMIAGDVVPAPGQPEARHGAHSANPRPRNFDTDTRPRAGKPMTRQEKRDAVDLSLSENGSPPDRERARLLGVSHTFVALRRRAAGNVAGADV